MQQHVNKHMKFTITNDNLLFITFSNNDLSKLNHRKISNLFFKYHVRKYE